MISYQGLYLYMVESQLEIITLEEAKRYFEENTRYRVSEKVLNQDVNKTAYVLEHLDISSYSFFVRTPEEVIRYANIRKRLEEMRKPQ